MSVELDRSLALLGRALDRLREALAQPPTNPLAVDGTIQRVEFTIELFWRAMKRLLAREGLDARTPRESLQGAYEAGWIADEAAWLDMLRARNETSHAYNEALARAICEKVRRHLPEMERAFDALRGRASNAERLNDRRHLGVFRYAGGPNFPYGKERQSGDPG